jgi:hypothetical protein
MNQDEIALRYAVLAASLGQPYCRRAYCDGLSAGVKIHRSAFPPRACDSQDGSIDDRPSGKIAAELDRGSPQSRIGAADRG